MKRDKKETSGFLITSFLCAFVPPLRSVEGINASCSGAKKIRRAQKTRTTFRLAGAPRATRYQKPEEFTVTKTLSSMAQKSRNPRNVFVFAVFSNCVKMP
jgi:hypothetical protein